MARRRDADRDDDDRDPAESPGAYDSLIDAERDALVQAGRVPTRGDLVRALRGASGLPPREARRAVATFIARRGGMIPTGSAAVDDRAGWVDGLLDAERADARRADRAVTRRSMLRTIRQASPGLSARESRAALADYLHRRGGQVPRSGWGRGLAWVAAVLALAALLALLRPRPTRPQVGPPAGPPTPSAPRPG